MNATTEVQPEKKKLPALAENSFLRYFSFSALYFAQGVPNGLLWYGLPAWLAMNGKTPVEIGSFIAMIGLPWSFKIIAAPIMDRFTYLKMGRRKPWIIFGQAGLAVSFFALAIVPDPLNNLTYLMIIGFMTSLFSIFQDIAVDGLAIDILPVNQQARANGLMWGSKIVGSSATVAIGSYLINNYGYASSIIAFSLVIFIIMLIPLMLKERSDEKLFPWSAGRISPESKKIQLHSFPEIIKSLLRVFFLPVSFFMGVAAFSYSVGRGLIDAILPVFTVQELGWTDAQYSRVFATTTLISGLLGMFVGGALIDFFGKIRMAVIYIAFLILAIFTMSFFTSFWSNELFVKGFFFGFYTFDTFLTIAVFAIAMQLCWKRISATQFTMYMAISNLGLSAGAWLMGQLKSQFDWQFVIMAYIVFILIMLVMMKFIRFDRHSRQINLLELKQSNKTESNMLAGMNKKNPGSQNI